jgi:hypothetical protein
MAITADVIKSTKIGLSVYSAKKKYFDDAEITSLSKEIIQTWKNIYNAAQSEQIKCESGKISHTESESPVERRIAPDSELNLSDDLMHTVSNYADGRRKVRLATLQQMPASNGPKDRETIRRLFQCWCGSEHCTSDRLWSGVYHQ